jgi:hypothetical protein
MDTGGGLRVRVAGGGGGGPHQKSMWAYAWTGIGCQLCAAPLALGSTCGTPCHNRHTGEVDYGSSAFFLSRSMPTAYTKDLANLNVPNDAASN